MTSPFHAKAWHAGWLRPVYEDIHTGVMAGGYVQVDETPVAYLTPGNGASKQGYLWACKRPGADVSFTWATSRAALCLERIIPADFTGTVQCDGYQAYPSFARRSESAPQHAAWLLLQIQHFYRIEKHLRELKTGPRQRQAVRASESRMIVGRMHHALTRMKRSRKYLPKSAMGRAIDYTLTMWPMLSVCLDDGRVEIDNNPVERAIRPTAIGKKDWLFIGEAEAGQRSAILFTIIEARRSRSIDPQSYLRDVLTRLPTMTNWQIKDVTPAVWAKAQTAQRKGA